MGDYRETLATKGMKHGAVKEPRLKGKGSSFLPPIAARDIASSKDGFLFGETESYLIGHLGKYQIPSNPLTYPSLKDN
jgi:hypothetical protein